MKDEKKKEAKKKAEQITPQETTTSSLPNGKTPGEEPIQSEEQGINNEHYQNVPDGPMIGPATLTQLKRLYGNNFGTSGNQVIESTLPASLPNKLTLLTWLNNCNNPSSNLKEVIEQGIELLKSDSADYNSLQHVFGYQGAEWSIHLGKILLRLKDLVRKSGQIWGVWAAKNLPFVGERTREKMMRLAKREDCWKFSILGMERSDVLCASIPPSKDGTNAIGSFLERHGIQFNPAEEFNLEAFKRQVDHALNSEKLLKHGFTIPAEKVAAMVDNGREVDGALLKEFKAILYSGGSIETHIDRMIMTGGQDNPQVSPEKRLQDVNTLAARLIKSLDYVLSKQDLIDLIDKDIYQRLIDKLNDINVLRDMANRDTEVTTAQV